MLINTCITSFQLKSKQQMKVIKISQHNYVGNDALLLLGS